MAERVFRATNTHATTTYDIAQYGDEAPWRIGMTAQSLQAVFPSLVQQKPETGYLWNKSSIVHEIGGRVLQEAVIHIKTHAEKIKRLEGENVDLIGRISELETKMAA